MAKFLKSGPDDSIRQENKAASKAPLPVGQSTTTVKLIRLAKPIGQRDGDQPPKRHAARGDTGCLAFGKSLT